MSSKVTVIGGKLKLKGDAKTKKSAVTPTSTVGQKRGLALSTEGTASSSGACLISNDEETDTLTEAQRRFKQKRLEREKEDVKKVSAVSFRERIEKFNEKLSKLTEHNDIPRVSAAGNG